MSRTMAWVVVALALAVPVRSDDAWEAFDDNRFETVNLLRHGVVQSGHDLQGVPLVPDPDWMRLMTKERHSYEARVSGLYWNISCSGAPCPQFDRMRGSDGSVLTAGSASSEDIVLGGGSSLGRTVRWIADADGPEWLLARGDQLIPLGPSPYDVVYHDTTLFVPRFNNTGTQTTVLVLQNTTNATVDGFAYFYSPAGVLLATAAVSVPQHGVQVMPTATVPGLLGQSGSVQIAQTGGYEALTGKAVALEPATGFTFDTSISALPR